MLVETQLFGGFFSLPLLCCHVGSACMAVACSLCSMRDEDWLAIPGRRWGRFSPHRLSKSEMHSIGLTSSDVDTNSQKRIVALWHKNCGYLLLQNGQVRQLEECGLVSEKPPSRWTNTATAAFRAIHHCMMLSNRGEHG